VNDHEDGGQLTKMIGVRAMRKTTNWDLYYAKQTSDPETRALIEGELKALRVGAEIARLRQRTRMSQTELAARAGMSAPNISRIERSPAQNMTLETLVKIARALGHDVEIAFPRRQKPKARQKGAN
jgi:DNA-binding Xre family transcriptional regulator